MDVTITNEQKVSVRLNPVTATGKPASLDGPASFEISSPSGTASVVPDADGLGASLVSGDVAETAVVSVTADADLGEGVVTISETINLIVTDPLASSFGLVVGTPESK